MITDLSNTYGEQVTITGNVSATKNTYVVRGSGTRFTTELKIGDSVQINDTVGNVITTLDTDVPDPPININLTTPSGGGGSGRLTVSWADPVYKGGSNAITNYDLEFSNSTSGQIEYKKFSQSSSPLTTPTGSVTSNTKFQVRIRANSNEGNGGWSKFYPIRDPDSNTPVGVLSTAT